MNEATLTFGQYGRTEQVPRHWFGAVLGSSALYVGLGVAALLLGTATKNLVTEAPVEVTFVQTVAKPEPVPPPAPPVVEDKPKAPPPAAAPVVPKNMKVVKLDKPPPAKPLVAPKALPQAAPKEADPSQDKGIAVYGAPGSGDPAGLEGGSEGGRAGGEVAAIALPEDADPPLPAKSNAPPEYPQLARAEGKTGMVILKVIIQKDGTVGDVEVMRGDEPFASAAASAVRKWRYEPARFKGQAITVYRIIQIPFKLTV